MSAIEREVNEAVEAAIRHGYSPATFMEQVRFAWREELREKMVRDEQTFAALAKGKP